MKKTNEGALVDLTTRYFDAEDPLLAIDSFIEYPVEPLIKFAEKIRTEKLSGEDICRMIELLNVDSYALERAIVSGIHPVTGRKYIDKTTIEMGRAIIAENATKQAVLAKLWMPK
jgi:hypothetical protein